MSDNFTLQNDPPKETRWQPPPTEKARQTVLWTGLTLPPETRNLFETDGSPEPIESKTPA